MTTPPPNVFTAGPFAFLGFGWKSMSSPDCYSPLVACEDGRDVLVWHTDGRLTADRDGKVPLTNAEAVAILERVAIKAIRGDA